MKKTLLLGILLLVILFAGCSGNRDELHATIEAQAEHIDELEQALQIQNDLQQEHLNTIAQMQADARAEEENTQFWHGLSQDTVREDFFRNAESLVRSAVGEVRRDFGPLQAEDVTLLISERFVYALVPASGFGRPHVSTFGVPPTMWGTHQPRARTRLCQNIWNLYQKPAKNDIMKGARIG